MTQPTPYMRSTDFEDNLLDSELEAIELTLSEVLAQLAKLQRDDDQLSDGVVLPHALASSTLAALAAQYSPRGDWVTATLYSPGDVVRQSADVYMCFVEHTSGTFATDLSAGHWQQIGSSAPSVNSVFGRTGAVVAASGDYTSSQVTNASGVAGTTVGAALDTLNGGKQNSLGYTPVNAAGDTMSGALSLPASDPSDDNHSSRKAYVDTVGKRIMVSDSKLCPHKNLTIDYVSAATCTVSADALILEDSTGKTLRIDSLSVTANIGGTVGSPLGLDTGAEASNTWYHLWAIAKADGTKSVVFSASSSAPNLAAAGLSGYTFYGYIGAIRNDGSSNFVKMYQRGRFATCTNAAATYDSTPGTSAVSLNTQLAPVIPPTATVLVFGGTAINNTGSAQLTVANFVSTNSNTDCVGRNIIGGSQDNGQTWHSPGRIHLLTAQTIWVYTNVASVGVRLFPFGWEY